MPKTTPTLMLWMFSVGFACIQSLATSIVRADLSDYGPFPVGNATVTVSRPNSSTFTALLYYPATVAGSNTPLNTTAGPYSAITFGHGFLQVPTRYSRTLAHLASYGHIVIASNSETGLFPNHTNFANDLRYTLNYLAARNSNPADSFFGHVDTSKFGLFGHSMGGGCGLLAAAADNRIKAVAGLASAITNPSPLPQMPSILAPKALLTGDQDGIVQYTTNTVPLYNAAVAPKLFPLIAGGFHVGFQDDPYPIFPDSGSLPRETQLAITRAYLTSFFGLYLKNQQSYWRNIWGPESSSVSNLTTQSVSGIGLVADPTSQVVQVGSSGVYNLTITNLGPQANRFSVFVEDYIYSMSFVESQTPILQPNQSYVIQAVVNVPHGASSGQVDSALISVRSEADQGTRAYVIVNTQAQLLPEVLGSQLYHSTFSGSGGEGWGKIDATKSVIFLSQTPQTVGLQNISTSAYGINGLVIDFANLNQLSDITFSFHISPQGVYSEIDNPIASWANAPAPVSTTFHPGEGANGTNRVLIRWPDGAIVNRYLRVRAAFAGTPISDLVVGHLVGEQTEPLEGVFTVTFNDLAQIRGNVGNSTDAGNPFDIDKNGIVAFADISFARTGVGTQLSQISVGL